MSFFDQTMNSTEGASVLQKALMAGSGTDAATYINGRAMVREDCENVVVNVLQQNERDWKLMAQMKKTPMKSTIHQIVRRKSEGDYEFLATGEGEAAHETNQELERLIVQSASLLTLRGVSKEAEVSNTFEDAYTSEKLAGMNTILKACEHMCFHGDRDSNPQEFDGFVKTLSKSAKDGKTASMDLRGEKLSEKGESALNDIARDAYERGAYLDKAFFPPILAQQFYEMFKDRIRYLQGTTTDGNIPGLNSFATNIGAVIKFNTKDAGADKFFRVKGKVTPAGDAKKRPNAPTVALACDGSTKEAGSQFSGGDSNAGEAYTYTVHAFNQYGRSGASTAVTLASTSDTAKLVKKGGAVELTITRSTDGELPTGYVICRSKAGETDTFEMTTIAAKVSETVTTTKYTDLNEDLPGTATAIFLPENNGLVTYYDFGQLMPISAIPMYPTDRLITPFIVGTFASLILRAPEYCAIMKNIGV